MSPRYDPKDHIQPLIVAPRTGGLFEQREITIQSYQTTVPFDSTALDGSLNSAWLTPQIRFGVFSRLPAADKGALNVVLGLQDDLTIRAYDYDERRPIWFSWQDAIVDTVSIHYFRDEDGLLRFTTTGGGRRITDDRLHAFNSTFLRIPEEAVTKRQFDLDKLRDLCFKRFNDRLYMIRFAEPSAEEYRSIDHALFQSRQCFDPGAERLKEISSDDQVIIESFDSDIELKTEELLSAIQVRFFIRGLSGSLRLRFPKIAYKVQYKTIDEHAVVFYRLVDAAVSAILDENYYAHQLRTLDDLSVDLGLYPDMVDVAPFREVLVREDARRTFFSTIDLDEHWPKWGPHLQAIDELIDSEVIRENVAALLDGLVNRAPRMASQLLTACQQDTRKLRIGGLAARALARKLHSFPADQRAQIEESILSWAVDREQESWDLDADSSEISMLNLKWRIDDFAFDVFPIILWKLLGVLHSRLVGATGDIGPLLRKYDLCIASARSLPANHSRSCAALRLVSAGHALNSTNAAFRVLKEPIADLRALDEAVLAQFGLPLWPLLSASRCDDSVVLQNAGIGAAWAVKVQADTKQTQENASATTATDILPGESTSLPLPSVQSPFVVSLEKYGRPHQLILSVAATGLRVDAEDKAKSLPLVITKKRLKDQIRFRTEIDERGEVVGASPRLLQVFESIHYANAMDDLSAVLLLGEPGVGKTHIAKLLHESSKRSIKSFRTVNAGGGGGDINIQRGEWIGYGKGHGIQGIDKNGRPGHLMNAEGGTLFIDEFAALSPDLQVIFLSVLDKRAIEKIGGESFMPDVRCIFATNADPETKVAHGRLRRDLLDRIPIKIVIPPLRERRGDILLLAKRFAGECGLADRCLIAILRHDWPGNVRELQSKIATAKAKQEGDGKNKVELGHLDLPEDVIKAVDQLDAQVCRHELWGLASEIARDEGFEQGGGLQRRTGEILGVGESQASKMLRELGLAGDAAASA